MEEGITAYEISVTDTEMVMKITVGEESITCTLRVNQAFAFITLFISSLGRLVSPLFPEAALGTYYKRDPEGGAGGQDPSSGSSFLH